MPDVEELAAGWSPLICRLSATRGGAEAGAGTGFLSRHGLVTASHVVTLPSGSEFHFESGGNRWSMSAGEARARIIAEDVEAAHDYAVLSLAGLDGVPVSDLAIVEPKIPPVGRQVVYLGHPFGSAALAVSCGYVSAVEELNGDLTRLRIDGSVNRGNSGGPLIDTNTGQLVGIVTRAETGFLISQMNGLKEALAANVQALTRSPGAGFVQIGGIDPVDATRATMAAILEVTTHMERSANVGIGYAFATTKLARVFTASA